MLCCKKFMFLYEDFMCLKLLRWVVWFLWLIVSFFFKRVIGKYFFLFLLWFFWELLFVVGLNIFFVWLYRLYLDKSLEIIGWGFVFCKLGFRIYFIKNLWVNGLYYYGILGFGLWDYYLG